MPLEQSGHTHTQTSFLTTPKEYSYTHLSRHFHLYTSGLQTIYLFIWTGSKINLESFLSELNTKHLSSKFEYEISKERISFLDTED